MRCNIINVFSAFRKPRFLGKQSYHQMISMLPTWMLLNCKSLCEYTGVCGLPWGQRSRVSERMEPERQGGLSGLHSVSLETELLTRWPRLTCLSCALREQMSAFKPLR